MFDDTNINFFKNDGPWSDGPWSSGDSSDTEKTSKGAGNESDSGSNKRNSGGKKDLEEFLKKINDFFSFNKIKKKKSGGIIKLPVYLIILIAAVIWLASGLYKINPDENGAVLYFGKFYSISTPGLNYHLPAPIGKVIKVSVTIVNKEEFGFRGKQQEFDAESLMLTGDGNVVDIDFEVQWRVSDIKNFLFNVAQPRLTIREATESAMREVIGKTPIADALSNEKFRIEQDTKKLLQDILDSYKSGIEIVLVQMLRVDPPAPVVNAYRDVQTAMADKERIINEAESFRNDIIPKARGEAEKIIQEAEAYKQSTIADAEGQAERFLSVYRQYRKARLVTQKRIYLETMEEIYQNMNKIIIDKEAGKSVVPYLPLKEIKK